MVSSAGDAKFFVSTSKGKKNILGSMYILMNMLTFKGEIAEWREELRRADQDMQIDVLKKGTYF